MVTSERTEAANAGGVVFRKEWFDFVVLHVACNKIKVVGVDAFVLMRVE